MSSATTRTDPARPRVHFASSAGGHVDLLVRVSGVLRDLDLVWVTQSSQRAEALVGQGERVLLLPDYDRNPIKGHLIANVWRSLRLALKERPKMVVTSGSGLVVPFCLFARLLGAKLVFVETSARVSGPSRSGRVLSRLAHSTIVQWPPMLDVYPGSKLATSSVVEQVAAADSVSGEGTFLGVGMHIFAFDRLIAVIDRAVGQGVLPRPVVAQTGVSKLVPRHFDATSWMQPQEIEQAVERAQYVVCHAGSGLLSTALSHGKRPLVLARRHDLEEHFDGHQEQIVEELRRLGLVVALDGAIEEADLARAREPLVPPESFQQLPSVAELLRTELEALEYGSAPARR